MIWKTKSREIVAVRIILIIALILATVSLIKDPNLTGFSTSENRSNSIPVWKGNTTWQVSKNSNLTANLNDYFKDPDYDTLTYLVTTADKISINLIDNILTITPDINFTGERTVSILVSDEFDTARVDIKILIGTEEERALSPITPNVTVTEEIIKNITKEVNMTEGTNITQELNITTSNNTQPIESNTSAISSLETEDNRSIKKFDKNEQIKDENNRQVGKKVKDEITFETFFTKIQKNETELQIVFYHNATSQQPVWIEGDIDYNLSTDVAEPLENITLIVPRVKGIIPKFKLHIGITSDVFEFGKTIPEIIFNGNTTLIDRDDEKIDVKLIKENSRAEIKGAVDVEFMNAKVTQVTEEIIKTDVFAANNVEMDNATIILPKTANINTIMECPEFNLITDSCPSSWIKTNIPFTDNGTHIQFTVTHFSGYGGAEIEVLNVQSYPTVGGNWEVRFTTTGTANLTIEAVDGTAWSNINEDEDLKFLELKCGDSSVSYSWINNKVFVEDYNCSSTGYEISKVLTSGEHHLKFDFGDNVKFANNYAGTGWNWSYDTNDFENGYAVAVDNNNNIVAAGTICNATSCGWFITKLNENGTQIANTSWLGDAANAAYGVAVDSSDNIFVAGVTNYSGYFSWVVIKYNPTFTQLVNATYNAGLWNIPRDIVVDNDDNVIVAGETNDGTGNALDYLVFKYDNTLYHLFNVSIDWEGNTDRVYGVAVDNDNNVTVVGEYASDLGDLWLGIIKFNSTLNQTRNLSIGIAGKDYRGTGIDIDNFENIYISGYYTDTRNHGITFKFDSNLNHLWNKTFSGGTNAFAYSTAVDNDNGDVFVTGSMLESGLDYIYTIKYKNDSTQMINYSIVGSRGYDVATDLSDLAIVVGTGSGTNGNILVIKYEGSNASNFRPIITNLVLNSSAAKNTSNENLTLYITAADSDNDPIKNITSWYKNNKSIFVLNMPFEGGSQDAVSSSISNGTKDYSGRGNNGTVNYVNYGSTFGRDGRGAYNFTKANSNITIKDSTSLDITNAISVSAWVRFNTVTTNSPALVCKTPVNSAYLLFKSDDVSNVGFAFRVDTGGTSTAYSNVNPAAGQWYHVVGSYDKDAGSNNLRVYVDGVLKGQATDTGTIDTTSGDLVIGDFDGSNGQINATIDEVMIFNHSLSLEQILILNASRTDIISSGETSIDDVWLACVTPNDGFGDGIEACSNNVTIIKENNAPVIANVTLNSSRGFNSSSENLTVYCNTTDSNNDAVKNITVWYKNYVSLPGLYMPFEADSKKNATDYSSYGRNATTITGAIWNRTTGYDGFGAYTFDGSDDSITVPDGKSLDLVSKLTIMFWINKTTTGAQKAILAKNNAGQDTSRAYEIYINASNHVLLGSNNIGYVYCKRNISTINEFHHVALTFNYGTMKCYIDGVLDSINTASFTSFTPNGETLLIGRRGAATDQNFKGVLDELMIFNNTLSSKQINAIYNGRTDVIVPQETRVGDVWGACITPNDRTEEGTRVCSNNLTVINNIPTHNSTVILNSSYGTNLSAENLTVYANITDPEHESIKNITGWYLNNNPVVVLNMPFEGSSTSTWTRDYSPYGINGTVAGATWEVSGGYDNKGAYWFDGINDYISVTDNDALEFGSEQSFSLEVWYKADFDATEDANAFITKGYHDTSQNCPWYTLGVLASDIAHFAFRDENCSVTYNSYGTTDITDGIWHHIVGVRDCNDNQSRLYVDGNLENYSNIACVAVGVNTDPLVLMNTYNRYTFGMLDDVRIYNTSLTTEQVVALNNSRTDLIVSSQTDEGDLWRACIIPNDGSADGIENCSNYVAIASSNTAPNTIQVVLNTTFGTNYTNENLTCYVNITDDNNITVNALYNWYNNSVQISSLSGTASINVNTLTLVSELASTNTTKGENWTCEVRSSDGTLAETDWNNATIIILNTPPAHDSIPILNSTYTTNLTSENLTVYADVSDVDGDSIKNITNWYVDETSITVLNMPFEGGSQNGTLTGYANGTKDYSGFGNNGTVINATWNSTGGHDGKGAYMFDGGGDYVAVGTGFNTLQNLSVSMWFKTSDSINTKQLFNKYQDTTSGWGVRIGALNLIIYDDIGGGDKAYYDTTISINTWHHIVAILESVNSTHYENKLYYDGNLIGSGINSSGSWNSYAGNLYIGSRRTDAYYFNGSIDDVMIFNRSLSAEQILALYQNRTDLIVSQETNKGETWKACITPNDGTIDGNESCSNNLTILNTAPVHDTVPILNSTYTTNLTSENLTIYADVSDVDGDSIKNITNWFVDETSITVLNMPFEGGSQNGTLTGYANGTKDYSGYGNNGTVVNATWNSTGGYDSRGAYEFNGSSDYISINNINLSQGSISFWIKTGFDAYRSAFSVGDMDADTYFIIATGNGATATITNELITILYTVNSIHTRIGYNTSDRNELFDNNWHLITITADSEYKIYLDGQNKTVVTGTGNNDGRFLNISGGDTTRIGNLGYNNNNAVLHFNGTIDDVIIFNRSLSAEQILALYQNRTDLIVSQETNKGETWKACVVPNDGTIDGNESCSNNLTILNTAPVHDSVPILNSTFTTNLTTENLTVYANVSDIDNDNINLSINWFKNERSYPATPVNISYTDVLLNMPFENYSQDSDAYKDYSIYGNDGTVLSPVWNSTGGYDGYGAYEMDGLDDYINLSAPAIPLGNGTICHWVYFRANNTYQVLVYTSDGEGEAYNGFAGAGNITEVHTSLTNTGNFRFVYQRGDIATGYTAKTSGLSLKNYTWYHLCAVYDEDTAMTIYINGANAGSITMSTKNFNQSLGRVTSFIGKHANGTGNRNLNGSIDEILVFNITLSQEEIWQIYNNRSDRIFSQETSKGEVWKACVVPNDGTIDGNESCSNNLTILNTAPNTETILVNSSLGTNTTAEDITCWVNATDVDSADSNLTIHFNWYTDSVLYGSGNSLVAAGVITNISTISSLLTTAGENWTCEAKAWDGTENETDWNNASITILPAPSTAVLGGGGGGGATRVIYGGVNYSEPVCTESWSCGFWSECIQGTRSRLCYDINNCGTTDFKPVEIQQCIIPEPAIPVKESPEPKPISLIVPAINLFAWLLENMCFVLTIVTYIALIIAAVFAIIYFLTRNYFEHINKHISISASLVAIAALLLMIKYAICKEILLPAFLAIAGIVGVYVLDFIVTKIIRTGQDYWMHIQHKKVHEETKSISEKIKDINRRLSKSLGKLPDKEELKEKLTPPKVEIRKHVDETLSKISNFNKKLKQTIKGIRDRLKSKPKAVKPVEGKGTKEELARISKRLELEFAEEREILKRLKQKPKPIVLPVIAPEKPVPTFKINKLFRRSLGKISNFNSRLQKKILAIRKKPEIKIKKIVLPKIIPTKPALIPEVPKVDRKLRKEISKEFARIKKINIITPVERTKIKLRKAAGSIDRFNNTLKNALKGIYSKVGRAGKILESDSRIKEIRYNLDRSIEQIRQHNLDLEVELKQKRIKEAQTQKIQQQEHEQKLEKKKKELKRVHQKFLEELLASQKLTRDVEKEAPLQKKQAKITRFNEYLKKKLAAIHYKTKITQVPDLTQIRKQIDSSTAQLRNHNISLEQELKQKKIQQTQKKQEIKGFFERRREKRLLQQQRQKQEKEERKKKQGLERVHKKFLKELRAAKRINKTDKQEDSLESKRPNKISRFNNYLRNKLESIHTKSSVKQIKTSNMQDIRKDITQNIQQINEHNEELKKELKQERLQRLKQKQERKKAKIRFERIINAEPKKKILNKPNKKLLQKKRKMLRRVHSKLLKELNATHKIEPIPDKTVSVEHPVKKLKKIDRFNSYLKKKIKELKK